jgi:hypothetical protein
MQKCRIPNILFDPLWRSMFGVPWHFRVTSDQKLAYNKMFLEIHFRRGIFYAKFVNLYLTSFRPAKFRGLAPQGDLLSKNVQAQKVFRF